MKNVIFAGLLCLMALLFASCSSNTPRGVAEKAIKCVVKGDYEGYLDCMYVPEGQEQQKEAAAQMLKEKVEKSKENGTYDSKRIVSYKFLSEDVDEEEGRATETIEYTMGNGSVKEEAVSLKKEDDGKWYLIADK